MFVILLLLTLESA